MLNAFVENDLIIGASICYAIYNYKEIELEQEINRILQVVFDDAHLIITSQQLESNSQTIIKSITPEMFYVLTGKAGGINEQHLLRLNIITELTANIFASYVKSSKSPNQQVPHNYSLHSQILDHIHESIITMDLAGFILSWNLEAEKLFGYTSQEAVGQNIIFLYDEEQHANVIHNHFLDDGGNEIELRHRKKSGEFFWASIKLTKLYDEYQIPIGLIGYLSDITEKKLSEEKIRHLAYFDLVTDLPNRIFFKQLLDSAIQQTNRKESCIAVLYIDLNRFKPVNEMLGLKVGDELLKLVAERFKSTIRENDVLARLGSDEFAIALINMKQHLHAGLVAQKLLTTLDEAFLIDNIELNIGASIGISIHQQDGIDAEVLLQKADIAMFKAKKITERANGNYAFYCADMNQSIADRMYIESGIRKALQRKEFFLQYQPKVNINTGKVVGAEALIRWAHPNGGIVFPGEFIHIAETSDLILEIDEWVLDEACQQAKAWAEMGIKTFRIAVNVSANEFTMDLPLRIETVLKKHKISPEWIELEITESMLMHDTEKTISIMREINRLGVNLALDDFGTGYSSLTYLKKFPINSIKIDASFINGVPKESNDCAITNAVIILAKQMQHTVIAEGVENQEQHQFLKENGCDEIQGHYYSKALDAKKFTQLIKENIKEPFISDNYFKEKH